MSVTSKVIGQRIVAIDISEQGRSDDGVLCDRLVIRLADATQLVVEATEAMVLRLATA